MRRPGLPFMFGILCLGAAAAAPAADLEVRVQDGAGAVVADAVVYAVPAAGALPPARSKTVVVDQIGKQFVPFVTVLQTGTAVRFPNKDNIRHEVYSFSPPKVFKLKLYSGVAADPVVFDQPGLVILGCNIHDRMLAFIEVVDTPWFAKTGGDGRATLAGLPAGDYRLHLWHPRLDAEAPERPLQITSAAVPAQEYVLKLGPPPMPLAPKDN